MPRPAKRIIVPVTFAHDSLEAVAVAAGWRRRSARNSLPGSHRSRRLSRHSNGATGTETVLRQADEQKLVDQIVSERLEELVEGFSAECARARS